MFSGTAPYAMVLSYIVGIPMPSESRLEHVRIALDTVRTVGTAGNPATGAQIAVSAVIHGASVYPNDTDFTGFPDVQWVDPVMTISGTGLRLHCRRRSVGSCVLESKNACAGQSAPSAPVTIG